MTTIEYSNIKNYKTESFPRRKEIKKEKKMENKEEKLADTFLDTGTLTCNFKWIEPDNYDNLKPKRVIYNGKTTICKWPDGTKTVVKATEDDRMTKEHGVAMAIIRKLFKSRQAFLRIVNGGYDVIEEREKRVIEDQERKEKARIAKQQKELEKQIKLALESDVKL